MSSQDRTKQVLEQLLAELYSEQAKERPPRGDSYLIAQDNQYLGTITTQLYDTDSILNPYGPYGSKYSSTSIFNTYSAYGSRYGAYSVNNPYCQAPPKLFIRGSFKGVVSVNRYLPNRIPTEAFLYALKHNLNALLAGEIPTSSTEVRRLQGESFIEAADGAYLGNLIPDELNQDSVFNRFGPYGSEFSQTSIFNPYSPYGSQFSLLSAFNEFTNSPPKVYLRGRFVGYLTKNKYLAPRIDPAHIHEWARKNVGTGVFL